MYNRRGRIDINRPSGRVPEVVSGCGVTEVSSDFPYEEGVNFSRPPTIGPRVCKYSRLSIACALITMPQTNEWTYKNTNIIPVASISSMLSESSIKPRNDPVWIFFTSRP